MNENAKEASWNRGSERGSAAARIGKEFEAKVADLYRLHGADVNQEILIANKRIDLLVTHRIPGGTHGHRVLVECKGGRTLRSQNTIVMELAGLLRQARELGRADAAEIVTEARWGAAAQGFALESGVGLFTYAEKLAASIDFRPYLKSLIASFDVGDGPSGEPPPAAYYVPTAATYSSNTGDAAVPDVVAFLEEWSRAQPSRPLAVLGEYGTGKSFLSWKLCRELAHLASVAAPPARIPLLFNLRDYTKVLDIEGMVTSFLDQKCDVYNPRYRLFRAMADAGLFVMVFDGFDEMAVAADAQTLERNMLEIEKFAARPGCKVILTSRIEYFTTAREETTLLTGAGNILEGQSVTYDVLRLSPWDDGRIDAFLERRIPLIAAAKHEWTFYRDSIRSVPELRDLSHRPVLLDMIAKTLPELIAAEKPIDRPTLYETYIQGELRRQKVLKRRDLLIADNDRFRLLEKVSTDPALSQGKGFTFEQAMEMVRREQLPSRQNTESITREFVSVSFLVRTGDHYRFSHKSLMEYLAARRFKAEIDADSPQAFGRRTVDPVVLGFLAEMEVDVGTLISWVMKTQGSKGQASTASRTIAGNALSLLAKVAPERLKKRNLQHIDAVSPDLSLVDLRETRLGRARLTGVNLVNAKVSAGALRDVDIQQMRGALYFFGNVPEILAVPDPELQLEAVRKFIHATDSLGSHTVERLFVSEYDRKGRALVGMVVRMDNTFVLTAVLNKLRDARIVAAGFYYDDLADLRRALPTSLRSVFDQIVSGELLSPVQS